MNTNAQKGTPLSWIQKIKAMTEKKAEKGLLPEVISEKTTNLNLKNINGKNKQGGKRRKHYKKTRKALRKSKKNRKTRRR